MLAQTTHQSKCQQIIRAKNSCRFALNAEELLGTLFTLGLRLGLLVALDGLLAFLRLFRVLLRCRQFGR